MSAEAYLDIAKDMYRLAVTDDLNGIAALLITMLLTAGFRVVHVPGPAVDRARRTTPAEEATARTARLRDLLTGIHPGPKRAVDPPLILLGHCVTPAEIRHTDTAGLAQRAVLPGSCVNSPTNCRSANTTSGPWEPGAKDC
ncbi:IS110 family transposase [Streptomyces sp. S6]